MRFLLCAALLVAGCEGDGDGGQQDPTCGNGVVDTDETCDGTELGGATCASLGFQSGSLGCGSTCAFDMSACAGHCGDGVIQGSEACDGDELGDATCASQGLTAGTLACNAACTFDVSACTTCGNSTVEGTEECDGTDLDGQSCATQGYSTGTLGCASCAFVTSECSYTIASCRLQYPTSITAQMGTTVTVFGRVQISGLTDLTSGIDPAKPALLAAVGYGADGSTPSDAWTWTAATANTAYNTGTPAHEAAADEYQGDLVIPSSTGSPYDYAYRFSGDGGATWTYCDTGQGSSDGYSTAAAGALTSTP